MRSRSRFGQHDFGANAKIIDKFLTELQAQLDTKRVQIEVSDEARNWLAREGYDEKMGARPLSRVIQEYIKKPLADEVLFGKLKQGGTVKVTLVTSKDGEKSLKLDAIEDAPVKPNKPAEASSKAKKAAKPKAAKASSGKGPPKSGKTSGSGLVPKVPLKT